MTYSHEVEMMCPVAQGVNHGAAPIPEEAKWVKAKEIKDSYTPFFDKDSYIQYVKKITEKKAD